MIQKEIIIDGVTYICTPKEETKKVEHEYVDLGLPSGRLWATCNLGTDYCADFGEHFSFGVNQNNTEDENDIVTERWGKEWRTPTLTDFSELIENTEQIIHSDGYNPNVVLFTSKINGLPIAFPMAGYIRFNAVKSKSSLGCYWSSTRSANNRIWSMNLDLSDRRLITDDYKLGFSIRPVRV